MDALTCVESYSIHKRSLSVEIRGDLLCILTSAAVNSLKLMFMYFQRRHVQCMFAVVVNRVTPAISSIIFGLKR